MRGVTSRTLYCHGLPGSPGELSAFETPPPLQHVYGLDRLSDRRRNYQERLLAAFDRLSVDEPVAIAGFSLGAMSALHIAAERSHLVRKLILISPAAPLELGEFLPAMAGRPVFEAARSGDWSLRVFTAIHASMVALAPRLAMSTMFRTSPEAERALFSSKRFEDVVVGGLRDCLSSHQDSYRSELQAYVRPWAHVLDKVQCETEIWGGSSDDWTPMEMSEALKARLGDRATLNICAGLGHYSTLHAALSRLN